MMYRPLFKIVIGLRAAGYLCQTFSGLPIAGIINFICTLPLILWGEKKVITTFVPVSFLSTQAIKIHSIAGGVSSLIIVYQQLATYFINGTRGNLELAIFGTLLFISFTIFNCAEPTTTGIFSFIYNYKHKLGSLTLLAANIIQYHAGSVLGKSGLSIASVFFIVSLALLFFVKNEKIRIADQLVMSNTVDKKII